MKPLSPILLAALALAGLDSGVGLPPAGAASLNADLFRDFSLRNIGPALEPARVADIAVNPRNRSVWYVAMASSGLWKTTNRGITWQPIFDQEGSFTLGCVTLDPANPEVVWLGSGENQASRSAGFGDGVYKSVDGGATWKCVGLRRSEHTGKILIDPRNSDVVYVAAQGPIWAPGGDRGLYKTADGGQTWRPILQISENTGISDIVFDPRNADVIYAASYQRRRHVGILIGGGPEGAIFKSLDAGGKWTKLTNGLPTVDLGRIALAVSPQNPDVVYTHITAADKESGFFRSADGGATWVRQNHYASVDPQYYGEIYADPHKFDRVYAVDMTIQVTEDGGKKMQPVSWAIHADNHAIDFDPGDEKHLLVGNDGGLYETYDGGSTWRHFDNMPVYQVYRVAADNALPFYNVYCGAQDNGTLGAPSRTVNRVGIRNSDWVVVGGGDGMQPRVDPTDPTILYTMSQYAAISRLDLRTSGNANIKPPVGEKDQRVRWNWDTPFIISPHSPSRLYFAGSRLFRSEDRGVTWKAISPDLTRQIDRDTLPVMGRLWGANAVTKHLWTTDLGVSSALVESPRRQGLLYVGTDDGLIQVSDNDGQSWSKIESFPGVPALTYVSDVCASAHATDTVYASFDNHFQGDFKPYLLKSTDRGRSWVSLASNLPDRHPVWSIVEDPVNPNLLFAGTEFGLFFTIDGGQQWMEFVSGVPTVSFRDLEIQARETDLVCGTFGRGVFILDDYTPLRYFTPATLEQEATLFPLRKTYVYSELTYVRAAPVNFVTPNPPFGAMFTYYLLDDLSKGDARISLTVADSKGKTIRQISGPATAGLHRVNWNLRADAPAAQARRGRVSPPVEEILEVASDEAEEEAEPQSAGRQELQASGGAPPSAAAGRGGQRGGRRGEANLPLVTPGKYQVTLGKTVNNQWTPLGKPQVIQVAPLTYPTVSSAVRPWDKPVKK